MGPAEFMIDGSNDTAWRADRGPGRRNSPSVAVVQFVEPLNLPAGTKLKVLLRMHHSGDDNGRHNTALGCCRISLTNAPDPKAEPVDYGAVLALATPEEKRTEEQRTAIFRAWRSTVADAKKFNSEAETLWKNIREPSPRSSIWPNEVVCRTGPLTYWTAVSGINPSTRCHPTCLPR